MTSDPPQRSRSLLKVCVFKLHEWDDEQMLLSRQPVLHTHDELYMQTLIDESAVHKPSCTVDVESKISIAGSTLSFRICVAKPSTSGAIS